MADANPQTSGAGRTNSEVGARVVMCDPKYHPLSQNIKITDYDLREESALLQLTSKMNMTIEQFENIGKAAKKEINGINNHPDRIMMKLKRNMSVLIYRDLDNNSGMKDGTASPIILCRGRFLMGPVQGLNTCSQDVMFWVALQLLVGLVQRDQLYLDEFKKLPPPAQSLCLNGLKPWAAQSYADQQAMNIARDEFCQALDDHSSKQQFSKLKRGEMHDFNHVLAAAVETIPQFSWTEVQGIHCCDGVRYRYQCIRTMSTLSVLLGPKATTVEDLIRLHFKDQQTTERRPCKSTNCGKKQTFVPAFILDCLPLTLAVDLGHGITASQEALRQPFKDISLEYRSQKDKWTRKKASYTVRGAVFRIRKSHFIARWVWNHKDSRCIHQYDGMGAGSLQVVELGNIGFFDGVTKSDAECVSIFYRRTDHKSPPN